ncbi:MAG: hypothetical protein SLagBPW_42700 [Shewanella algae]
MFFIDAIVATTPMATVAMQTWLKNSDLVFSDSHKGLASETWSNQNTFSNSG